MANKPKVAICWFAACGGCDETIVDLNADVLKVTDAVDIILWPVALDFKYHHIEEMKDGEITLAIINGGVRNSEQEEIAKLLRQKFMTFCTIPELKTLGHLLTLKFSKVLTCLGLPKNNKNLMIHVYAII